MDDLSQLKHLDAILKPIAEDSPCGEDFDTNNPEELTLVELNINKAVDSREWKSLKKDIQKLLEKTKDLRLVAHFSRALLQTEKFGISGVLQGLYLTREFIDSFWDCVYPPEDKDDPDEKYADRINAIADLGSWASIVLPLRKKCALLTFEGIGDYYLEDLVAFQNGDQVEGKQPAKDLIGGLSSAEIEQIDKVLASFEQALALAEENKALLLEKTGEAFTDFDSYLIPNLEEGILLLAELSPNANAATKHIDSEAGDDTSLAGDQSGSSKAVGSIKNRSDVVKALEMICDYYAVNEPSSPLPLLLARAKSIVHKDFLEVLEELVPDSVSMTTAVFGRKDDDDL